MYNVPTYTKFGLHRVPRTDHRRKSRTPCIIKDKILDKPRIKIEMLQMKTAEKLENKIQAFPFAAATTNLLTR